MKIERLEVNGFKSFFERIIFQFHPGVTAIVGPNGCGKSNVVDSFKWVLGEQSAKSLRGERMDDVIFSGSATKKPKGMAEVFLYVSDFQLPDGNGKKAAKEFSVARRIFRSGESDYLINKRPCRLKDIRDFFLDTGLGVKSYSIFEQGRVDAILQSKPDERRFIIDEVAGVSKYKVRKLEAIQKIEAARQNLVRLQDVICEVKRQVDSLSRQVKKAEKYKKLSQALRDAELRAAAHDYAQLMQEWKQIKTSTEVLKNKELSLSTETSGLEANIERRKLIFIESEKSFQTVQAELHKTEKAVTTTQGKIDLLRSELQSLEDKSSGIARHREELKNRLDRINTRSAQLQESLVQIQGETEKLTGALKESEAACLSREAEVKALEVSIREDRKALIKHTETVNIHKNRINSFELSLKEIERRQAKLQGERTSTENRLQELEKSFAALQTSIALIDKVLGDEKVRRQELRDSLKNAHASRVAAEQELYKTREEAAGLASRLESLKEMDSQEDGTLPAEISTLDQVADILEAEPEYEIAVEAAVGERLRFYLVNDKEAIKKSLVHVRQAGSVRSGFALVGFSTADQIDTVFERQPGVAGKALDFVTARQPYKELVQKLLGSFLIVKDLDTAIALWDRHGWNLVTLEGDVLTSDGFAKGGKEGGVLKLKRQIRELKNDLHKKRNLLTKLNQSLEKISREVSLLKRDTNVIDKKISSLEREKDGQVLKLEHYREELTRLKRRLTLFDAEADEIRQSKNKLAHENKNTQEQLELAEKQMEAVTQKMEQNQAQIDRQKEDIEARQKEVTGLKLSLVTFDEKRKSFLRESKGLEGEKAVIQKKNTQLEKEKQNIEKAAADKTAELQEREKILKATIIKVISLKAESERCQEETIAIRVEIDEAQKVVKAKSVELEGLRKELAEWTVKREKVRMKIEQLEERTRETYGVDIAAHRAEPPRQNEAQVITDLKKSLENMGQVNPEVVEEYNQQHGRYENLIIQQKDLIKSIEQLESIINNIDSTIRARLTEAFNKINEKFKEVFVRLFGNGRAELSLLGNDILESGIEIIAQPPGKKPRSLMALSGGEKALTAISLLFAGFMIKPTPLCIFDEVDASLDEFNTGKFANMIKELSRDIQFILITHNKLTMEAADFIYGVTMEEAGSSSVVSIKFGKETYENKKTKNTNA